VSDNENNTIAEALLRTLETPNEMDRNMETPANIVDGVIAHIRKGDKIFIPIEEINRINQEGCE